MIVQVTVFLSTQFSVNALVVSGLTLIEHFMIFIRVKLKIQAKAVMILCSSKLYTHKRFQNTKYK